MGILSSSAILRKIAVTLVIAIFFIACKEDIPKSDLSEVAHLPTQVVEKMILNEYSRGVVVYMVTAPIMERYSNAEKPYDLFPKGIVLLGYTEEGELETKIRADYAKHVIEKKGDEIWEAFGNVVVNNYIKEEKMESDTLYWNRNQEKIYTHSLVKLTTPEMFMQGYGMESDEMARNAVIMNPFDSYAIVQKEEQDSTATPPPLDSITVRIPLDSTATLPPPPPLDSTIKR